MPGEPPNSRQPEAAQESSDQKPKSILAKEVVDATVAEFQQLLADVQKCKTRPKLTEALARFEKRVLSTLVKVNAEFQKQVVPILTDLLQTHVETLLKIEKKLGGGERNPARNQLLAIATNLQSLLAKPKVVAFSPLRSDSLAESTGREFNKQAPVRLSELKEFRGSGVYAIYYDGGFELYAPIAEANKKTPGSRAIYVGEAGRQGKRKGRGDSSDEPESSVFERLANHKESIEQAQNLDMKDFLCRYLIIEDLFIPLCENLLIDTNRPLWNYDIEGFGNKHVGKERKSQQITKWDLLHPGRPNRATQQRKDKYQTPNDVADLVRSFFKKDQVRQEQLAKGLPVEPVKVEEMAEPPSGLVELAAESSGSAG